MTEKEQAIQELMKIILYPTNPEHMATFDERYYKAAIVAEKIYLERERMKSAGEDETTPPRLK
jgi:hypothetical protein